MDNQLVKTDLIDAILELRQEVERRLQANKYYVAMNKLDELLAAGQSGTFDFAYIDADTKGAYDWLNDTTFVVTAKESAGEREVTSVPSRTTSRSTQFAPALTMSSLILR